MSDDAELIAAAKRGDRKAFSDLVVKYQAADVSNTAQAYQDNIALIKALLAKYPEFRDGFSGVVARAVDTSGRDYGSLLQMKDVK